MPATIPIICDGCQKRIMIEREMLDQAMVCSECETPIEVELYPPLVKARDEVLAGREAAMAAVAAERNRQREREQAEREAAKQAEIAAKKAARLARQVVKAEARRAQEAANVRTQALVADEERRRLIAERAHLQFKSWPAGVYFAICCFGAFGVAAHSLDVLIRAENLPQQVYGELGLLVAAVVFLGGACYYLVAKVGEAVTLKIDAVRDLQVMQLESLTKLANIAEIAMRHQIARPEGEDQPEKK